MASSLLNLVNDFAERVHKIKCKNEHDNKKLEICGIKNKDWDCFHEYRNFKDDLIECECLCCNKNHQKKCDENLKTRFFNACKFF